MTQSSNPSFEERLLTEFHRRVPDVTVVLAPQPKAPSLFGVHAAQVAQQTAAAMEEALRTLAGLWPLLAGGLPAPPTVRTEWRQEAGYTTAVLAVVSVRHPVVPLDKLRRVTAAGDALAGMGWVTRRRDPRPPRYLRLLARHGRTAVEVSARTRPDAYDVEVRHGPVLVGHLGSDLLTTPAQMVPFPSIAGPPTPAPPVPFPSNGR